MTSVPYIPTDECHQYYSSKYHQKIQIACLKYGMKIKIDKTKMSGYISSGELTQKSQPESLALGSRFSPFWKYGFIISEVNIKVLS